MESLVVNDRYFKFNPEINREPVKIRKNGVIWQKLGERVADRAAAFCIRWSCLITFLGKPLVKLWCNRAWTRSWAASKIRCLRMSLFLRSGSVLIAVTREEPGILKDFFRRTPTLPPVGEASTLSSQTWICHKAGRSRCNWDDITRSTVLSFFFFFFCLSLNLAYSEASI